MSGAKSSWENRIVERLIVFLAIAMGPVFVIMVDELNLTDLLGACFGLIVWAVAVTVIIGLGGPFRYVVWQLAAVSLAIAVLVHYLPHDGNPIAHLGELATLVVIVWLVGSVVTAILPVTLFVESVRDRQKHLEVKTDISIVPPGL